MMQRPDEAKDVQRVKSMQGEQATEVDAEAAMLSMQPYYRGQVENCRSSHVQTDAKTEAEAWLGKPNVNQAKSED